MLRGPRRIHRTQPSGPGRGERHPVQPARRVRLPLRFRPRLQHPARLVHAAFPQPVRRAVGRSGRRPPADRGRHSMGSPARSQDHHRRREVRAELPLPRHPVRSVRQARRPAFAPHVPSDRHQPSEPAVRHADSPVPPAGQPCRAVDRLRFQPVQHARAVLPERRLHAEVPRRHHHARHLRELLLGEPHHRGPVRRQLRRHRQRGGALPGEDRRHGPPHGSRHRRADRPTGGRRGRRIRRRRRDRRRAADGTGRNHRSRPQQRSPRSARRRQRDHGRAA